MDFSAIATTWARLEPTARMLLVAEGPRMPLAEAIAADNAAYVAEIEIVNIDDGDAYKQKMRSLTENDLLLVLLTMDGFMVKGYREEFSPFDKPDGLAAKYIFVRLDISEASLLTGLNTDLAKVEDIIEACQAYGEGKRVRVTTDKGTDITVKVAYQELLPYHAREAGGHAFLPPAEISEELAPGSANGVVVADVTVGEVRFGAELIDTMGLVDEPVRITVKDGMVTGIAGGDSARRLEAALSKLGDDLRVLVELGHGLSDMAPTGIIGVDESMNGTCHFGIGDRDPYHVDVVVANPCMVLVDG